MSSHPQTYKAAQIKEKEGPFELVDVQWKDPKDGEIVVKVLACGVCHSDGIVKHQIYPTGFPRIPGHEIVGDVVAVPPTEKLWKVGDRVGGGWHGGHCSICKRCRAGDYVTCENEAINGIFSDGGYAEYVTLRTEAVASIPRELDPAEAAPLMCAGITTFNSIRNMGAKPGDVVAVQGIGGLGHLALQYCRAMGFYTVALSSSESKKQLAQSLGAHEYVFGENQVEALQKLGGAKVIVCTAPNSKVIQTLVNSLSVDGELLILALADELSIPVGPLISKRLSLKGWPSGTAKDSEEAVAFAKAAGVRCHVERFPLDKVNEAYESMASGKARFRAVLVPA
ncbi:GroES-like protein [Punctularia strigosozonata HHB-11173 SS5]|uniref:GroES-like protein n=1 Tax=Punctularia strigosozonata (strain HHB-11173) TaxID=741275 RepID=UPI0004418598|nr:GroES-like protein [Punctularia strigosozonata HHB-11173 SS5]EIN13807.1 GroES-like protein [Punctularia strigosozonata HHB-11173 SS5]